MKRNLLLVDDDPKALRLLEIGLRRAGFNVVTAGSGVEALAQVEAVGPEVIVSDSAMPEMDGFEFCARLREDSRSAHIPFLFLVRESSLEDRLRAVELGADDFVPKPAHAQEVATRVRLLVARRDCERLQRASDEVRLDGDLHDLGVADLVGALHTSRRTGAIRLVRAGEEGHLFLREGRVVDAVCGAAFGELAFYRLLRWEEGRFEFTPGQVRQPARISIGTQALLQEGLRRVDEWERVREELPSLSGVFEVNYRQLASKLGEIPDEVNAILRLFDGRRSLTQVVEDAPFDDLSTLNVVAKLFGQGLVVPVVTEAPLLADAQVGLEMWLTGAPVRPALAEAPREHALPAGGIEQAVAPEPRAEPPPAAIRQEPARQVLGAIRPVPAAAPSLLSIGAEMKGAQLAELAAAGASPGPSPAVQPAEVPPLAERRGPALEEDHSWFDSSLAGSAPGKPVPPPAAAGALFDLEHHEAERGGRRAWWWIGVAAGVAAAVAVVLLLWPKQETGRPRGQAIEPTSSALASRGVPQAAVAAAPEPGPDAGAGPPKPSLPAGPPLRETPPPAERPPVAKAGPEKTPAAVVPEPSAPPPAKEEKKLEKEKAETVDKPERGLAALLRRGQTQLKRGKFGAAAKTFREAVEADPKSADAHYGLGRALYDAGREPASQPHLERALALKPGLADIYVLLGAIYQSKGETEKAKKAYQTYLKKRPRGKYAKELQSVLQSM